MQKHCFATPPLGVKTSFQNLCRITTHNITVGGCMSILCLRLHFGQLCVREVLLLGRGISVSKRMALCTWNIVCDCKLVNVCAVNPVKKIVRKTLGEMQAVPVLSHASVQQGRESNPNSQLSSKHPRGSKRHLVCASKKMQKVYRCTSLSDRWAQWCCPFFKNVPCWPSSRIPETFGSRFKSGQCMPVPKSDASVQNEHIYPIICDPRIQSKHLTWSK